MTLDHARKSLAALTWPVTIKRVHGEYLVRLKGFPGRWYYTLSLVDAYQTGYLMSKNMNDELANRFATAQYMSPENSAVLTSQIVDTQNLFRRYNPTVSMVENELTVTLSDGRIVIIHAVIERIEVI